jgi:hypothetical protein
MSAAEVVTIGLAMTKKAFQVHGVPQEIPTLL